MIINENFEQTDLLEILLDSSLQGLESFSRTQFPEAFLLNTVLHFGSWDLSIGLRAVKKLQGLIEEKPGMFKERHTLHEHIEALMRYSSLIETIEKLLA